MFLTKYTYPKYQSLTEPFFELDALFAEAFDLASTSYSSRLKLNETDSQYTLSLELPGYSNKDVEVSVENYILSIKAENNSKGATSRKVSLWKGLDFDKISGKMENGILTVTLPKIEKEKPKKIKID